MLHKEGLSISIAPTAAGTPIIDRTKYTTVFSLSRAEALTLIDDLAHNFGSGSFDRITIAVEADNIFVKDRD